jgi:multimeric flavodoxin WrbA
MASFVAVYGSPRKDGNSARILKSAVDGAVSNGAQVKEFYLRDKKISPCLEIYGCAKTGRCVIKDDFQEIADAVVASDGLFIASPIFFYTVSAHTKAFMDRCQSLWMKKYEIDKTPFGQANTKRLGLFIGVGATKGKRLFDGALLTMRYFFDTFDMALHKSLLYRGLDNKDDILAHPDYLKEAFDAGVQMNKDADERV